MALVGPSGAQVIRCLGHLARGRIAVEVGLETTVRFFAPTQGRQRLAQFLVRQGKARVEADGLLEQRDGLLVASLQGPHAAEIFVKQGLLRCQGDGLAHLRRGLVETTLFRQGATEQRDVLHAAGIHEQVVAADFFRTQWTVRLERADRTLDAVADVRHQSVRALRATPGRAICSGGR